MKRGRQPAELRQTGASTAAPAKAAKPSKKLAWDLRTEELFVSWHRRVAAVEKGHHQMSDRFGRRYIWLGLPVVVLSTVVGTSAFASLQDEGGLSVWVKLAVGGTGILAAALSSAQTFFGYAQRAERHRIAAVRYESLRRDMAHQLALPQESRPDAHQALNSVRTRMEKYAKESPPIPQRHWEALCREYKIDTIPPDVV